MKNKTSVLIVDSRGKENKIIQIPTKLLLNWKSYFIALNSIILILVAILGIFLYQKTNDYYKEKLIRASKVKSLIDIKKAKTSFESIDSSIYRINKFLDDRGIENFKIKNSGGISKDFEIKDINETSSYYEKKIYNVEMALLKVPIGVPVDGVITSKFGNRNNPFGNSNKENHSGIDFRGKIGDPVKATSKGVVEFAGVRGGYGNCIIIKHENSLKTLFGHLSKINVRTGDKVKSNQIIGEIGSTGRSTGPHLHYEIYKNNIRINPEPFFNL